MEDILGSSSSARTLVLHGGDVVHVSACLGSLPSYLPLTDAWRQSYLHLLGHRCQSTTSQMNESAVLDHIVCNTHIRDFINMDGGGWLCVAHLCQGKSNYLSFIDIHE